LNGPEDVIVRQGEECKLSLLSITAYDIFFIAKGDNFVSIKDTQKEEEGYKNFKKLVPGEHFGVSLLSHPFRKLV